ncbi:hypothetical protein MRX96_052894 [Rhipicephalus microplus]
MPANRPPTIDDLISQAQGKMQNTSSLLRYVLLAESLKIWVPCDDSSSDDSSSGDSSSEDSWSDDSSTDDGADSAPAVSGTGVVMTTPEPMCKRRRLDDFHGEWRGDTDDLNTLKPRPGQSGFQDDSSEEDDGDV